MRRNGTSFLIAVMLAAATWACDQAAPTSPTPVAAVSAGGLTASTAAAPNAATSLTATDVRSAKGGKKPPKDDGGRFLPTCDNFTTVGAGIRNDTGMYCDSMAGITADIISDTTDGGHNLSIGSRSGRTLRVDLPAGCVGCPNFSGGAAGVHFLSPLGGGFGPRVNFLTMPENAPTQGGVSFTFTVAKRHEVRLDYGVDQLCPGGTPSTVTKTSDTTWTVVGTRACISEKVGNTRETLGVYDIAFSLAVTRQ